MAHAMNLLVLICLCVSIILFYHYVVKGMNQSTLVMDISAGNGFVCVVGKENDNGIGKKFIDGIGKRIWRDYEMASLRTKAHRVGRVKCWGYNKDGRLGLGDKENRGDNQNEMGDGLPYVDLGKDMLVESVSTGAFHACAKLVNGHIKCWGFNENGQLGYEHMHNVGDSVEHMGDNLPYVKLGTGALVRSIYLGGRVTCVVLDNESVKCYGDNSAGQLGLGDKTSRGGSKEQMGDSLPVINLGTVGGPVQFISCGALHICALFSNSKIKCWGKGSYGRLGYGDKRDRGDDQDEMGDNLPFIDLGVARKVIGISAGNVHTCAALQTGALKCWGFNGYGQLGYGDMISRGDDPSEMGGLLPRIDLGKDVFATSMISTWWYGSCAVMENGSVKCWGSNKNGELGLGDRKNRGDDPNEMGDMLPEISLNGERIIKIATGNGHPCVLTSFGRVKCWGFNKFGQLGLEDDVNRVGPASDIQDNVPFVSL